MNLSLLIRMRLFYGLLLALNAVGTPCQALDETFALIQTKTAMYSNVTVTTKTKDYIVMQFSGGLVSLKPAELTEESYRVLGYGQKKASGSSFTIAAKARALVESLPTKKIEAALGKFTITGETPLTINAVTIGASLALVHLIFSFCAMRICQKVGNPGGIAVWLPIIQLSPIYRAAKMSPAWLLALIIPVLNVWAHILWSVKISKARGKGFVTALFLIFPITFPFAFLYLASASENSKAEAEVPEERMRASGLVFETS